MKQGSKCVAIAALVAASVAVPARADVLQTGYLFDTDYGTSLLDRYQYTYDKTTNRITAITPYGIGGNTSNAYFLGNSTTAPIKEGIQGTSNDLIIVGGAHGSASTTFSRYTLDGTFIGSIPVDFSSYNGGSVGIGNVVATPDGRYVYAPLEKANAIVKIDLTNGSIVASYAFTGAHDVALAANGTVYAANYASGSAQLIALDGNLNPLAVLASANPAGVSGSFRPTGISVAADGSLYVDDNTVGGSDSILHYTLSGSGAALAATFDSSHSYIGSATNNALEFTFGNNIGPDGEVYVAALGGGGAGGFSTRSGYVDGLYAFDPTAGTVTQAVQGYTEPGGPGSPSGLSAPKYLQFEPNFISSPDAGVPVPEPGTFALLLTGIGALGLLARRRRGTAGAELVLASSS